LSLYEIRNLWFSYPDKTQAIQDVSFRVFKGETLCIVGRNGAGKTTLLFLLAKLLKPSKGEIIYKGENLRRYPESKFRKEVGIVFQDPTDQFFNPTSLDEIVFSLIHVGYSRSKALRKAKELLDEFDLLYVEDKVPHRLSFGEKKILAFLTISSYDPNVLLLDEPFANVDFKRIQTLLEIIRSMRNDGKTLIISTQSTEYLPYICDRVIVMNDGKIAINLSVEELLKLSGLLVEYGLKPIRCEDVHRILKPDSNQDL